MMDFATNLIRRPESEHDISRLARHLVRVAGVRGVLPTPMDQLFEAAKLREIVDLDELSDGFLQSLSESGKNVFRNAYQKLRGILDLRRNAVFIPNSRCKPRMLFAKGHELGHHSIPWHRETLAYLDTDRTLSPSVHDILEQEANHFSTEVLFQGKQFRHIARDFKVSFNTIFMLAKMHGVSNQSTAWRFVEEQDELVAVAQYYPSKILDAHGNRILRWWKTAASPKLKTKFDRLGVPPRIGSDHPWAAAMSSNQVCSGIEVLKCDESLVNFTWEAWWNSHALLVLLRRKPVLSVTRFAA